MQRLFNFIFLVAHISCKEESCWIRANIEDNICSSSRLILHQVKACLENNDGFAVVSGPVMKTLLKSHGAEDEDLQNLERGHVHDQCPLDLQPLMLHRHSAAHRVLIDTVNSEISTAGTHSMSQIPQYEISEMDSPIPIRRLLLVFMYFKICFYLIIRSGNRYWSLAPTIYQKSSVPQALAKINMILLPDEHHHQDNIDIHHNITINDHYLFRVTRNASMDTSYSPTPEGIHQDHSEISSVTLVGRYNVSSGGETRLWKLSSPTGNYDEEEFVSGKLEQHLLLNHALTDAWETVFFNDRRVKHEARAIDGDGQSSCVRDVIVNLLRKPLKDGTDVKLRRDQLVPI